MTTPDTTKAERITAHTANGLADSLRMAGKNQWARTARLVFLRILELETTLRKLREVLNERGETELVRMIDTKLDGVKQ